MERLLKTASEISGVEYDIDSYADIVSAIHVIQTDMGITGTTAAEAASTIEGSLNTLKAAFANLLTGMGDANADLDALVNNVYDAAVNVVTNITPIVENVLSVIPDVMARAGDLIAGSLDKIVDYAFDSLLPAVESAIGNIANAIQPLVQKLGAKLPEIVKGLTATLPDIINGIFEIVPDLVDGLLNVATAAVTGLIEQLPTLIPQIVTGIIGIIPKIFTSVAKSIGSVFTSIGDLIFGTDETVEEELNRKFREIDTSSLDEVSKKVKADLSSDITVEDSSVTTNKVQEAVDAIKAAIMNIPGLTEAERKQIEDAVMNAAGRDELIEALKGMGLTDTEIAQITAEYDTYAGSIYQAAHGVYSTIESIFTDGQNETGEDIDKAKAAVEAYVKDAQAKVDEWYKKALDDLELSGLSGAELAAARDEVTQTYIDMTNTINETGAAAYEYIDNYAGMSTEKCAEGLEQLWQILEQVGLIDAEMDRVQGKAFGNNGSKARKVVQDSATSDEALQLEAFGYTKKEYDDAMAAAEQARTEAYQKALEDYKGDKEEYQKAIDEADAQYERSTRKAQSTYQEQTSLTAQGIMGSDADIQAAIDKINQINALKEELLSEDFEGFDNVYEIDAWLEQYGMTITELAKMLDMSEFDLKDKLMSGGGLQDTEQIESAFKEATDRIVKGLDDTEAGAVIAKAVEDGYITEISGFDFSAEAQKYVNTNSTETIGVNIVQGIINGMESKLTEATGMAAIIAQAIINKYKSTLGIASPSKVMKQLGEFTGMGLDEGMRESLSEAVSNAQHLVGAINLAPKMDLSGVQSQLAGIQGNTAQPSGDLYLTMNSRTLGKVAAADMNSAVNGFTRRIALGYGRG